MNTSEPKSPSLPRELLHTIFSLSEPGPNATYLSEVCRDWRDVYKELLYSTITIFDKETVKEYEHGCIDYSVYYYLMNDDQKHGVSLEKEDKGNGKTWVQLDLLCRTLSESNGHLASYVQKIDFCAKVKGYTYFLPIAYLCRNVTHLCLRGQLEHDNSLHSSVKMAVKSLSSLRVLQSEGFFPGFSMPDVVSVLAGCPNIRSITVGLVAPIDSSGSESPIVEASRPFRKFPKLQELCFLPSHVVPKAGGHRRETTGISFPTPNDAPLLSELSLPNLVSFSAWMHEEADSLTSIKKCLVAWAPHLKQLTLVGGPPCDDIAPHFTQLTDLTCDDQIFSASTILRMKTLERLSLSDESKYSFHQSIRNGIRTGQGRKIVIEKPRDHTSRTRCEHMRETGIR